MAVNKRNGKFYIFFKPFGDKRIGIKVDVQTEIEARITEKMIMRACKTNSYESLDEASRAVCQRMFENHGWELPECLAPTVMAHDKLTLRQACELFLRYPTISACKARPRYEACLMHLVGTLGSAMSIRSLWIPTLRQYQAQRLSEGAAPTTINWEMATLSKLFGVLIEMQLVDVNPCRLIKALPAKTSERDVYLSCSDVESITAQCPTWFKSIVTTAYFTGMRRGEIFTLTWPQVDLTARIVKLGPEHTKEGKRKRVPLRHEVVNVLENCRRIRNLQTDRVFLIDGRIPNQDSLKNPWRKACVAIGLSDPRPRLHDLRHSWRTNAARSGMDPQIAESILGHWFRGKSVSERYRRISDSDLLSAVDNMTFDHGETEILVSAHHGGA